MRSLHRCVVVAATAALALVPSVASAGWWTPPDRGTPQPDVSTFALIGDTPYGDAQVLNFPKVVDQINADPDVEWVGHVGDIKSGSSECTDEYFDGVRDQFDRFAEPLVYTPGDNEWTDCHRESNGSYQPYERLSEIRDTFFTRWNRTLGESTMRVASQWYWGLPENVRFSDGDAEFAAVHVVGSNNGLDPWTGATRPNWYQRFEVAWRTQAAVQLIDQTFRAARRNRSPLVVIMMQADMFDPTDTDPSIDDLSAFRPIVSTIRSLAARFNGDVLLLDGDSHVFHEDQPLAAGSPWLDVYGVKAVDNLTRVTVEGSTGLDEWLKFTVVDGAWSYERVPYELTRFTGVKVNEVESQGGEPGDWVELVNLAPTASDVSGFVIKDDDDTHAYALPEGTVIPAGGYLAIDSDDVTGFDFGLGGSDTVRLYAPDATTLLDSTTWDGHAASTWGRCEDGTGEFGVTTSSTKGAANDCAALVGINEIESSGGEPGDWVELYNPGPRVSDISGWTFSDDDDEHTYVFPDDTVVPAGEYLVVDSDALTGFDFGLGGADSVRLFDTAGTLVDSYSWTSHAAVTYGRCPNWVGDFAETYEPTRGAANVCGEPVTTVKINETESSGGEPGDWIELINIGSDDVDLGGWQFRDDDDTHTYDFPLGTVIPAGGYVVIDEGTDFDFGFGSTDTARLFSPDGTLIDSFTQPAHAAVTWGRCPDGTGEFADTGSPTKGAANDCEAPAVDTVRVNEVESNGDSTDWVELINIGDGPVDVSGWTILDNDDTHTPYEIPAGTTIDAGGYLVVDDAPGGLTFGLGGGDSVRLFRGGGTLADSYTWTEHATTTYGRCPDGIGEFGATTASTRGAANDCPLPTLVFNEVESNGDATDWFELLNTSPDPIDLSGYSFLDNDDSKTPFVFPAGTVLAPGAYLAVDNDGAPNGFDFGLGGADSVRLFDTTGALVTSFTWTEHATSTYGRCPDGIGEFTTTLVGTKGGPNACGSPIVVNEVESNGDVTDWVELYNPTGATASVAGFTISDDDDTHVFVIPSGTTIDPLGHLVIDTLDFGLGGADSVRLFDVAGDLVDSYTWTSHAATTYGRCPDGSGEFETTLEPTKGGQNRCAGVTFFGPWPGSPDVHVTDDAATFSGDMSGLAYEASGTSAPGVVWAVENGNGLLYRMIRTGSTWTPDTGWETGKVLSYPGGTGTVDAEGVTLAAGDGSAVFVGAERDNTASSTSRNSVLLFDTTGVGGTIAATTEWDLTADLPVTGANAGIEAMAWVPDTFLVANGFVDETTGLAYVPADHPGHGDGLFFVGLEATGGVYAYALNDDGTFARIATIDSGFPSVMALEFDSELGDLWAVCDDGCQGRSSILRIDGGAFTVAESFERPTAMPNINNEGFTITPLVECVAGVRPVLWTDDSDTDGHSFREGTITCP